MFGGKRVDNSCDNELKLIKLGKKSLKISVVIS